MGLINGKHIGHANNVISMAVFGDDLIALTSDHKLWSRSRFEEDKLKPWDPIPSISPGNAIAIAISGPQWYIATNDNRLKRLRWRTTPHPERQTPAGFEDFGEANGVVAMTADVTQLYAAANDNILWRRKLTKNISWDPIGQANKVVAMAAISGQPTDYERFNMDPSDFSWLFAVTNEGNIGKTWIRDSFPLDMDWVLIDVAGNTTAMTAVNVSYWSRAGSPREGRPGVDAEIIGLLYMVTGNQLWVSEVVSPKPWTILQRGRIRTSDEADLIDCTIESNVVSGDNVEFVLTLGPGVTWKKGLGMRLPNWRIEAEGNEGLARNTLSVQQIQNGKLIFDKAKKGGELQEVHSLGELGGLSPGSRVTFRWLKD